MIDRLRYLYTRGDRSISLDDRETEVIQSKHILPNAGKRAPSEPQFVYRLVFESQSI